VKDVRAELAVIVYSLLATKQKSKTPKCDWLDLQETIMALWFLQKKKNLRM